MGSYLHKYKIKLLCSINKVSVIQGQHKPNLATSELLQLTNIKHQNLWLHATMILISLLPQFWIFIVLGLYSHSTPRSHDHGFCIYFLLKIFYSFVIKFRISFLQYSHSQVFCNKAVLKNCKRSQKSILTLLADCKSLPPNFLKHL